MTQSPDSVAVFPGTFDPVTLGHLDLIRRASRLFDRLVVGVGHNPEKSEMFSPTERVSMIEEVVSDEGLSNIKVKSYDGLTMEFAKAQGANIILRGIRDSVDLRDELQFANANLIVGDVETVFLMTTDQTALTSSSLIKQIVELGGAGEPRLAQLLPRTVLKRLQDRLRPTT
jgi:pantetheine-phosphate adenylyltransferase